MTQLFGVPLRMLGEHCRAGQRTEVIGLLVPLQAPDRALKVDGHLADGIDRQVIEIVVDSNDRENLDRLDDVP